MGSVNDNWHVKGHLSATSMSIPSGAVSNTGIAGDAAIARTKLAQETLTKYPIKLTDFRVHDAMQTVLPNPSANDDLGLYGGTFGTDSPMLKTYDVKAAGAVTLYARVLVELPAEYDDAETVEIRIHAEMQTTVADTTATVDVECYESDKEGGISADLCATAAQSINSLVDDDYDFTITATDLVSGDVLDIRIAVAVNDAATGTAVVAAIGSVELLCDIRG
jgi:hypothetical protein